MALAFYIRVRMDVNLKKPQDLPEMCVDVKTVNFSACFTAINGKNILVENVQMTPYTARNI